MEVYTVKYPGAFFHSFEITHGRLTRLVYTSAGLGLHSACLKMEISSHRLISQTVDLQNNSLGSYDICSQYACSIAL